ncbi:hypothetical protein RPPS3_34130 [Rhodopseudomonas palustris]|nr:hypothetical protein RPPS3_34130 [Rhodopseudomonas palustris]
MKTFGTIAALFFLIILAKAGGLTAFDLAVGDSFKFSMRQLLVVELGLLGYFIFLLEGVQSSIMLANKQSEETLQRTFGGLDLAKRHSERAMAILAPYVDHQPIYGFVVGRQIIIIACALLFKAAYDGASLNEDELNRLSALAMHVPSAGITVAMYAVVDNRWFSFLICSVAVAFAFQVTAKVMAQNYPMRFLTMMKGAIYVPLLAQYLGCASLLAWLLSAMSASGRSRVQSGKTSYFDGREVSFIDSVQTFEALTNEFGEAIHDLSIEITRNHAEHECWSVHIRATYRVVSAAHLFAHVLEVSDCKLLEFSVTANAGSQNELHEQRTGVKYTRVIEEGASVEDIETRLFARFGSEIPAGSFVTWDIQLVTPIQTTGEPPGFWFDLPIRKPAREVNLYVEDNWSADPEAKVHSIDGVIVPRSVKTMLRREKGRRHLHVKYPPIDSLLRFWF